MGCRGFWCNDCFVIEMLSRVLVSMLVYYGILDRIGLLDGPLVYCAECVGVW